MVASAGPRRSPAPSPEGEASAQRPRTAPPSQPHSSAPVPKSAATRTQERSNASAVAVAAPNRSTHTIAPLLESVEALVRHPVVRDLIRENEGMLMELSALRNARTQQYTVERRLCGAQEAAARAALTTSESLARLACASAAHQHLAQHTFTVERLLVEETRENEELRSFAELAQAQLDSSLHASHPVVAQGSTSPPVKVHRAERGSGATDGGVDSRRTSLQEITNLRGPVKRLRSVESSESGTPGEQRSRPSATQRSPEVLTRVRKTMQ